jgi:copper(I)-binding protein
VALAVWLATTLAPAQEYGAGAIRISKAWTREMPAGAKVGAGFMTIVNTGKEPDTLIGGSIPIAVKIEVHEMSMDRGMMKMRRLEPGLTIKPGETVVLRPGSFHLMFLEMAQGPKRGTTVKGTLLFEKAGRIDVEFGVEPVGAREPGDAKAKGDAKPKGGGHGSH